MNLYEYDLNSKEGLIDFYKKRYVHYYRLGLGGYTTHGTKVTKNLLKATLRRLDQLIKGKKTYDNMHPIEKGNYGNMYREKQFYNSNRSFGWNYSSSFRFSDLTIEQQHSIDSPTIITETYIDNYTTAYRTLKDISL